MVRNLPANSEDPRKSHGQRGLLVYIPWSCKRVENYLVTKQHQHFSLPSRVLLAGLKIKLVWDISGFPGSAVVKNPVTKAGDTRDSGSIPGQGRYPGVRNGNWLQYSGLENSMDWRACRATVHVVAKSQTWLEHTQQQHCVLKMLADWPFINHLSWNIFSPFVLFFFFFLPFVTAGKCLGMSREMEAGPNGRKSLVL